MRLKGIGIFVLALTVNTAAFALIADKYTIVEENNKKGLANEKGELVIPVQYDDLGWSKGAPLVVNNVLGYKRGRLWGLINVKNKKLVNPSFTSVYPANDRLLIASKLSPHNNNLLFGAIHTDGSTAISFRYYSLSLHNNHLIASYKKDKLSYGLLDLKERTLAPMQYQQIRGLSQNGYAIKNFSGQYAFYFAKKSTLTPFKYDSIFRYNDKYLIVVNKGKKGLMDLSGHELIEPAYQDIRVNEDASISVLPFTNWHAINKVNQKIRTFSFDEVYPIGKRALKIRIGANQALIDTEGKYITELAQFHIDQFEGEFAVITANGKKGIINKQGDYIVMPEYDEAIITDQFLYLNRIVQRKSNWSVFTLKGEVVTGPEYHEIYPITPRIFAVKVNQYWGLVNTNGDQITSCKFDTLILQSDGNVKARFLDQEGVLDMNGEWVAPPKTNNLIYVNPDLYVISTRYCKSLIIRQGRESYCADGELVKRENDLLEIRPDGKLGLWSFNGERLLPVRYDFISALQADSIYTFRKEGEFGVMTKSGNILTEGRKFDALYPVSEEFLGVAINGRFGFVDANGDLRIANRYDSIKPFSEGYAAIKLLGKWGFIDKMEKIRVQPRYAEVGKFQNGLAVIKTEGSYGLVNKQDKLVLKPAYDRLERIQNNRFISYRNGKAGLIGSDGTELVYPKYDHIEDLKNGYVIVERNGKYGMATLDGMMVIPMMYAAIRYDQYNDIYLASERPEWQTIPIGKR